MKRTFLVTAAAAALAAAGMYPAKVYDWFSQTFAGLRDGAAFTGTEGGASGGAWETIPDGRATVATVSGRKCVTLNTRTVQDGPVQFNATQALSHKIARFDFSICGEPTPWFPKTDARDKGALVLMSTEKDGVKTFGGYTGEGWKTLYAHGLTQRRREWIDCRAEFDYSQSGEAYVTYYASCDGGSYQALADADGTSRFKAAGTSTVGAIAFDGSSSFGAFTGTGVDVDAARKYTWTGLQGQDWNTPGNWDPARVPGMGDMVTAYPNYIISYGKYTFRTYGTYATEFSISNNCLTVGAGDLSISCDDGDFTSLGTVVVEHGATLRAYGKYAGIETAIGSTLVVNPATPLVVTSRALSIEGVAVLVESTAFDGEGVAIVTGPYGSGGVPSSLALVGGSELVGFSAVWHGKLAGDTALWLVNDNYGGKVAEWNDGAWGNLVYEPNWGVVKPSANAAAWMGDGRAHVNGGDSFEFQRRFEVGAKAGAEGEVSMSGGSVVGVGTVPGAAVLVGARGGRGVLDVVGGTVRPYDYLWNYALTVGADTNATGAVTVRGGSVNVTDGGVSVGEGGEASMEISEGATIVNGPLAVGYQGRLAVAGGVLAGEDSFYIGRAMRTEAYDVTMTVDGGTVSNTASGAGAFWVGWHGGLGSQANLLISDGLVCATNRFVCGGYRSARVVVAGGVLASPEIRIGHDLVDEGDVASFNLVSGRVETAGFTAGANGVRTVELAGGELVASTTNEDFFAGLDLIGLTGETAFANESNVTIRSALMGAGGLAKSGKGTLKVAGYVAWAGKTVVDEGELDMDGGMVMGELSVAEDASIVNAKYDDIDTLIYKSEPWMNGTASVSPYLQITSVVSAVAMAVGADGVVKGSVAIDEDANLSGWTALGWTGLGLRDGMPLGGAHDVKMMFDFSEGKHYVIYYVLRDGNWERLVSADGLTVFPVAGVANVETFTVDGVEPLRPGDQLTVDTSKVLYWIGADGNWNDGSNWSFSRTGGAGDGVVPRAGFTAFIEKPVTVTLGTGCAVESLVVNAAVTISGKSLEIGKGIGGVGALALDGAELTGIGNAVDIALPVEIWPSAMESLVTGNDVAIRGAVRGSGTVVAAARIFGDTSAFAGRITLMDGGICAADAAANARSAWQFAGGMFPFAVGGIEYVFGSLGGSFSAQAGDPDDVSLVVGARNEDCTLTGAWCEHSHSGIKWIGTTSTLRCDVANSAYVKIGGGGAVSFESALGLPGVVSFVEMGGELKLGAGVVSDVSGLLRDSTAPVVFNDGGRSFTWARAVSSSNVGGFVKRGSGTLTWQVAPESSMDVTVEEGVLIVPFGTRLGRVVVADGAQLVVDLAGARPNEVVFAASSSDRKLVAPCLRFANCPEGYSYNLIYGENNSVVAVNGSSNYTWTGAAGDMLWSTCENWLVDGVVPDHVPMTNDTVLFAGEACTTVVVDTASCVMKVSGVGDLRLVGGEISTLLFFELSGYDLELEGASVVCGDAFNVRSIRGQGAVTVSGGVLTVSPQAGKTDAFDGVLRASRFVKRGEGLFRYVPAEAFAGMLEIEQGELDFDCAPHRVYDHRLADVSMKASAVLDLAGRTVTVGSFTGAGTVQNGVLVTADGLVTQSGGHLVIPAVEETTYVASHAGEKLEILDADGKKVKIVIPREWFVAGASGRKAVRCGSVNIVWDIRHRNAPAPVAEDDDWWSIPGGGFAVRIR